MINIVDNYLYNNDIKLRFNSEKHKYFVKDKPVPSVTTILGVIAKPALINWAANQAVEFMQMNIKPGQSLDEIELSNLFKDAKKAHFKKKTDAGQLGTF